MGRAYEGRALAGSWLWQRLCEFLDLWLALTLQVGFLQIRVRSKDLFGSSQPL